MKHSLTQTLQRRHRGHRSTALALLLLCFLVSGCLILPVNYHTRNSRHNITMQTTNALQIGVSTKEDVLMKLGEPDFASEDQKRIGYLWSKVKFIWAVVGYGGGASGEATKSYLIEATFDSSNRISGLRALRKWGQSPPPTDRLKSPPIPLPDQP